MKVSEWSTGNCPHGRSWSTGNCPHVVKVSGWSTGNYQHERSWLTGNCPLYNLCGRWGIVHCTTCVVDGELSTCCESEWVVNGELSAREVVANRELSNVQLVWSTGNCPHVVKVSGWSKGNCPQHNLSFPASHGIVIV